MVNKFGSKMPQPHQSAMPKVESDSRRVHLDTGTVAQASSPASSWASRPFVPCATRRDAAELAGEDACATVAVSRCTQAHWIVARPGLNCLCHCSLHFSFRIDLFLAILWNWAVPS